jgi:hypothetical protein
MSDQGLSIFDNGRPAGAPASAPGGSLPQVRRGGYDPAAVDARIRELTQAHATAASGLTTANARVAELEKQVAKLKQEVADNGAEPSFASLGGRASTMLRLAEEEAAEIKASAEREAADIRDQATKDATALRAATQRDLEAHKSAHHHEMDEHRTRVMAEAEQTRTLAQGEADDHVASAQRAADQVKLAAQQETTELRSKTQREVEQARAGADREVQEARRMLAVEKERLAREATDHHNSALAETRRLVEESEARANGADERARIVTAQIADQRAAAQKESEGLIARAKREAESLLTAAKAQAESIVTTGNAEAERALAALKGEVERMTKRRDAITAQLSSLSELVGTFGKDDDEPSQKTPADAEEPVETGSDEAARQPQDDATDANPEGANTDHANAAEAPGSDDGPAEESAQ